MYILWISSFFDYIFFSSSSTSSVISLTKSFMIMFFSYSLTKTLRRSLLPSLSLQPIYCLILSKDRLIYASFYKLFLYYWSIFLFYSFFSSMLDSFSSIYLSSFSRCSLSTYLVLMNCLNLRSCWISLFNFSHCSLNCSFLI